MARTHTIVVISVRPWLEAQGLSLGVESPGLVKASCRIGFHAYSGNVVIVAPPIAIIGARGNGISAKTACCSIITKLVYTEMFYSCSFKSVNKELLQSI